MQYLEITEDKPLTMDVLYEKIVHFTEIPLSARLRTLFSLLGNNSKHISMYHLHWVLLLLYWQEACCFSTGKFCSCLQ